MWRRKLTLLVIAALIAIVAVLPFRTHAVKINLTDKAWSAQLSILSPREMLESAYLTPSSIALIAGILAVTAYFAVRIIRTR